MYHASAEALSPEPHETPPPAEAEEPMPSWAEEVLTPEQFFTPATDSTIAWTGERRLLFAVLQDAVDTFLRYRSTPTTRGRRLFHETQQWFWSTERDWLFSFENICAYLHLDADYIRQGLKCLPEPAAVPSALFAPSPCKPRRAIRHLVVVNGRGER